MTPSPRRRIAGVVGIGAALAVASVLLFAGAASAHVKVSGIDVTQGGYGVLQFRVPSESETASTTGLTVTFPSDTPILSASTQQMPGWTATVTTAKLAKPLTTDDGSVDTYVSQIDWTADSAADAVPPKQFQFFTVSVGPLPKKPTVSFPALQRYSDGTTVNWNEASEGGAEPEHPAPVLSLPEASGGDSATTATTTRASSDGTAWIGVVGIVLGALGLVAGVIALLRTGRKPSTAA